MERISSRSFKVYTLIETRQEFTTHGALWAAWDSHPETGRLPAEYRQQLRQHHGQPVYVVYSYATPIAWWCEGTGWVVPDTRYSATTSKHQGTVRRSIPRDTLALD
jgi:hypothetical protein